MQMGSVKEQKIEKVARNGKGKGWELGQWEGLVIDHIRLRGFRYFCCHGSKMPEVLLTEYGILE